MDQRELYDAHAEHLKAGGMLPASRAPSERDAEVLKLVTQEARAAERPVRVLELAVGDGALTFELAKLAPSVDLTGVDISAARVEHARRLLTTGGLNATLQVVNLDTEFAILRSEAFGVVIALDVLEHVFDVFGFVAHCARILQSAGALILRVPNVAYLKHRVALLRGELPVTASWFGPARDLGSWREKYGWDGGHLHYFTLPMLRELLRGAGLRIELCADPGASLCQIRRMAPSLLCGNLFVVARK